MTKLLAVLAAAALVVGVPTATAQPLSPSKAGGQTTAGVFTSKNVNVSSLTGLEPGQLVWIMTLFRFTQIGPVEPLVTGALVTADENGVASTTFDLDAITHHEIGLLTTWASKTWFGPQLETSDGWYAIKTRWYP